MDIRVTINTEQAEKLIEMASDKISESVKDIVYDALTDLIIEIYRSR